MKENQWLLNAPETVAKRLLGCVLERRLDGKWSAVKIVETEAYHQADAASHSFKGKTPRTEIMFGKPGKLYVYFTYGMHYCINIVTGPEHEGAAVLIRAVEPLTGWKLLRAHRPNQSDQQLTNGPAKLAQALALDKTFNGHDLSQKPLLLHKKPALPPAEIVQTTRIGISQAKDVPWRFYIRGNPYVSKR